MKKIIPLLLFVLCVHANAQYTVQNAHSHNDYANNTPFWIAYNAHFGSIEADIFAVDGELFVAHDPSEIQKDRTLDELYLKPIIACFQKNQNSTWPDYDGKLQLMIDLKTLPSPTLDLLIAKLEQYPEVFDRSVNPNAVQAVVSGNMPNPADFGKYPAYIKFDGRLSINYSVDQLERVAIFSDRWDWPDVRTLSAADRAKVENMIRKAHSLNRKIRFWATNDTPDGWKMLMDLGVDFINTDKIDELSEFLKR